MFAMYNRINGHKVKYYNKIIKHPSVYKPIPNIFHLIYNMIKFLEKCFDLVFFWSTQTALLINEA